MKHGLANLVPPQRLEARALRRRRRGWTLGLSLQVGVICAASVAARQYWPPASPALAAELGDATDQITRLNGQISKQRKAAVDAAARDALLAAIGDKPQWGQLLKLIDQTVSDDLTIRQSRVQEAADHSYALTLSGVAQSQGSVSQFVLRLQQYGLFKDVRLGRSEREPFLNGSAISFEVICPIDALSGALP